MATLRELKGRIGSVASSEKITGAMKMISSAKMHKAESILRRLMPYRECVGTIIGNLLSSDAPFESPLAAVREVRNVALVVWGSDDGLCGAYNVNIFKHLLGQIQALREEFGAGVTVTLIPVGRKMTKAVSKIAGVGTVVEVREDVNSKSDGDAVRAFNDDLRLRFLNGEVDVVRLLFMEYRSAGKQVPVSPQFLPLTPEAISGSAEGKSGRPCLFEPDAAGIYAAVLPMFMLSVMQEAFAQNRASEQAARVMAMQSANDNAQKLLEQLQLEYNKLRQQSITTELLDIVGGQVRD